MKTFEERIMNPIKYAFALIIVVMGGYGYYRFFNTDGLSFPVVTIIVLFVVIELAIMTLTTIKFSSSIKQRRNVDILTYIGIFALWIIASVGIDSTIWHMIEDKYEKVRLDKAEVRGNEVNLKNFEIQLLDLKTQRNKFIDRQTKIENQKIVILKDIKRYDRNLRSIIYSVANCNESVDCTSRKNTALETKAMALQTLTTYNKNLNLLSNQIASNNQSINNIVTKINSIKEVQVAFEKEHRVQVDNQKDESVTHVWLMNGMNNILGINLENPQRAYVIFLSFIVYPLYILFIMFTASNSQEMKEQRKQAQLLKEKDSKISSVQQLLSKIAIYLIKTRKRKVKEIEKEVIKEVEIEVEKIVYKDGKEIIKVEVEKPIIVDQEKVVEKIVQVPVVEKEYVVIPAGLDLNELNKSSNSGMVPEELKELIKDSQNKLQTNPFKKKGANNDQHKTA